MLLPPQKLFRDLFFLKAFRKSWTQYPAEVEMLHAGLTDRRIVLLFKFDVLQKRNKKNQKTKERTAWMTQK